MKAKELKELRELPVAQVAEKLEAAREAYFKLRFQFSTGQLPNTAQLQVARREVARITTVLQEMERASE